MACGTSYLRENGKSIIHLSEGAQTGIIANIYGQDENQNSEEIPETC